MNEHGKSIDNVLRKYAWRSTQPWVRQNQQHTFRDGIFARFEIGPGGLVAWFFNHGLQNGSRTLIRDAAHAEQLLKETGQVTRHPAETQSSSADPA